MQPPRFDTQAGMLASALIAFMSDNGGPSMPVICNGGLRGGKGTPFEGGVRAPAFVYWPACLGRAPTPSTESVRERAMRPAPSSNDGQDKLSPSPDVRRRVVVAN